jgi:hypothetical protein
VKLVEKGFSADFSHLRTLCKSSPIVIVLHSKAGVIVVFAFPKPSFQDSAAAARSNL